MEALTLGSIVQNQIQINQSNITTETGTAGIIRGVQKKMSRSPVGNFQTSDFTFLIFGFRRPLINSTPL